MGILTVSAIGALIVMVPEKAASGVVSVTVTVPAVSVSDTSAAVASTASAAPVPPADSAGTASAIGLDGARLGMPG